MILEIKRLMGSEINSLSRVGNFLYDIQDRNDGLTQNELVQLVSMLGFRDLDAEMEKKLDKAYDHGYEDAKRECNCDCY